MNTVRFIQTRSDIRAAYEITDGNGQLYLADIPFNFSGYRADLYHDGILCYRINWNQPTNVKNFLKGGTQKETAIYDVLDGNENVIGHISRKLSKFFGGYYYYDLELYNEIYQLYEVGLGKQGIWLPIYNGEKQIALGEKDHVIRNNNDCYTLYFLDGALEPACILLLYYDYLCFGRPGEISVNSQKSYTLRSTNKELKRKYDPNWLSSVER